MPTMPVHAADPNAAALRLSAQRALAGRVTPTLRAVQVACIEATVRLHFCFDQPPSDVERMLCSEAAAEVVSDFPDLALDERIECLPMPAALPHTGHVVYRRHEPAA